MGGRLQDWVEHMRGVNPVCAYPTALNASTIAIRVKRPAMATPAAQSSVCTDSMKAMLASTRMTAMTRTVWIVLLFKTDFARFFTTYSLMINYRVYIY